MRTALTEAGRAEAEGEVPVGAVLADLYSGKIISSGRNQCIALNDPSAHAEIMALRRAGRIRKNYRLQDTVLVVTLEPCLMCLGAIVQARTAGVVFGARDPRAGALFSRHEILDFAWIHSKFWIVEGILEQKCLDLLQDFFRDRR